MIKYPDKGVLYDRTVYSPSRTVTTAHDQPSKAGHKTLLRRRDFREREHE